MLYHCDGCGADFIICHALDCKRGNLITARYNDLRDGVASLSGKAFAPAHARNDPRIFTGRAVRGEKAKEKAAAKGKKELPTEEE